MKAHRKSRCSSIASRHREDGVHARLHEQLRRRLQFLRVATFISSTLTGPRAAKICGVCQCGDGWVDRIHIVPQHAGNMVISGRIVISRALACSLRANEKNSTAAFLTTPRVLLSGFLRARTARHACSCARNSPLPSPFGHHRHAELSFVRRLRCVFVICDAVCVVEANAPPNTTIPQTVHLH